MAIRFVASALAFSAGLILFWHRRWTAVVAVLASIVAFGRRAAVSSLILAVRTLNTTVVDRENTSPRGNPFHRSASNKRCEQNCREKPFQGGMTCLGS